MQAIVDTRRRARRVGLELRRGEPLDPGTVAFLAEWIGSAPAGRSTADLCVAALTHLWFETDGPVMAEEYIELWRERTGGEPPTDGAPQVRRNERRMRRRGPYDTPAAWVHGQWFFAHDRPDQIVERFEQLGLVEA